MTNKKTTKFQISELLGIAMILIILGISIAYSLDVLETVQDDVASCDSDYTYNSTANNCYETANASNTASTVNQAFNATGDTLTGVAKIPEKLPTIATVVVAAVILSILMTYLYGRFVQ